MKGLKYYFKKAERGKWALGQFNISNLETLRAIIQAAEKLKSPVIIGTSEGESRFLGLEKTAALVSSFKREKGISVFLNLDHGKTLDYIKKAVRAGYDAVHFDGSNLSLKENIKITKTVVSYCRRKGILVEGEVGCIKGKSQILKRISKAKKEDLTDPKEAENFIKKTGVDSLAVNIGTFHGMKASGSNPHINKDRLKEIRKKTKSIPLVLHGGSGTPEKDIKTAINLGVAKINVNTELRRAYTETLRRVLKKKRGEVIPYKYLSEAIEEIQKVVEEKIKLFGSANKA